MSLYNNLFGVNPLASVLMVVLNLDFHDGEWAVGRFRDIYVDDKCEKITLYTRNGGGNRKDFQCVFDKMKKHPNYIKDYDDDFDATYAYIEFSVPAKYKDELKKVVKGFDKQDNRTIHEKFESLLNKMGDKTKHNDTEVKKAYKVGEQIVSKIEGTLSDSKYLERIQCPKCSMISYSKGDIDNEYCGNCHEYHKDMI